MRKFLSLFLVIGLAGCTDGIGIGLDSDVRGVYTLEAVNGRSLPYVISDFSGVRRVIYAGTLRLERDRSFSETLQIEEDDFGRVSRYSDTYHGDYETTSRGEIFLYYDDGETLQGDFSNRELRLYGNGATVVYRRY